MGYSGEMSDFYNCIDPHSRGSFILNASNQAMLRPVFPQPIAVHSSHSNMKNSLESQSAEEGISTKQMFGTPYSINQNKGPHLSQQALATCSKPMAPCLATIGHMATVQHVSRTCVGKDKLTSRQIDSIVSDIFNSDLQYHDSSGHQHQQTLQDMTLASPSHSASAVKKRNRKKKEPKERKKKPAGTHIPREEIKRRRCQGEEYVTRAGKVVEKKVFRMVDCKCRRNCTAKVPKEVRKKIFEEYHAMADWNSQTQFIVASVVVTDIKRRRPAKIPGVEVPDHVSRRGQTRVFYLTNKKIQVCKTVFMTTLGITGKRVDYALRVKAIPLTAIATPDRRGKKEPKNKTSAEVEERIRAHIHSFPRVGPGDKYSSSFQSSSHGSESPLSSASSEVPLWSSSGGSSLAHSSSSPAAKLSSYRLAMNKLHLPQELTVTRMYQLYQDQCRANDVVPASMWVYTKVLYAESKYKPGHSRQGDHSSVQTLVSSCKCCDRSYAILTSSESPERKVQLLLEEHRNRLSQFSASNSAPSSSKTNLPLKAEAKSKSGLQ